MVLFYAEILRGVAYRDNNFKPIGVLSPDNDPTPSHTDANAQFGASASSDGDILTFSGTSSTATVTLGTIGIGISFSTTAYPYLVVRMKAVNPGTVDIKVGDPATFATFTATLTTKFQTLVFTMPSGHTVSLITFLNQSVGGNIQCDYTCGCAKIPIQLSQRDLISGTVTRTSLGVDHAELVLNNKAGKFVTGSNAFGFGDHLHIYLGQGSAPYHVYGGYVELQEPTMPADEITIHSRGFGLALLRSKVLQIYNNTSPRGLFNDVLQNWVNPTAKNGINALRPYQLTSSYVQDLGSAFPLYVTNMNHAYNVLAEIGDQTVAQNNSAVFFVDPAENLHFVPLGSSSGSANWTTDPFPALYPIKIAIGSDPIITKLTYDSKSLVNRVHYYGIAQIPGQVDGLTEYANDAAIQAAWNIGGFGGGATNATPRAESTAALHSVTSPVAIGAKSNQLDLQNNGSGGFSDVGGNMNINFTTPSQIGLGALDLTKLGSKWSPPLIECHFRVHVTGQPVGNPAATGYYSLLFFKDNNNYFEYQLTSQLANAPFYDAILNAHNLTQDFWYHPLIPIGPNAGNLFLSAPAPNIIPQPTSGDPPWKAVTTGTPNWNLINGIAFYATFDGGTVNTSHVQMYLDGFRIIGGRYRLAYDSRTLANGAYPDMSEAFFYDPISKDELAIKNFAQAELERLRKPIIRGSVTVPLKADIVPEQQVQFNIPSANLLNTYLRCTTVTHHFSQSGFLTELGVSNDFRNSQPLDQWKLANVLAQMGENAIFSRELYDLKTAILDPTFTPITDAYT